MTPQIFSLKWGTFNPSITRMTILEIMYEGVQRMPLQAFSFLSKGGYLFLFRVINYYLSGICILNTDFSSLRRQSIIVGCIAGSEDRNWSEPEEMGQLPCGNLPDSGWGEVRSGSSHLIGWTIWMLTWLFAENTTGQPLCIYWPVCGLLYICAYIKPLRLKFLLVARTFPGTTSRLTTSSELFFYFETPGQ